LNSTEKSLRFEAIIDVIVADGTLNEGEHQLLKLISDAIGLAEETRSFAIGGALKYRKKQLEEIELKNLVLQQKEEIETLLEAVSGQKDLIEKQNTSIIDSIKYAKHIQEAILPQQSYIEKNFPEHLLINQPKDIVSGDFYWMGHSEKDLNLMFVANADCTGHGVP
jgi:serine phosphatase RsbU (regulator of sigma subunit)